MISALVTSLIGANNVSGYSVGVKPAAYAKTPEAHEARNTAHLLFGNPARDRGVSFCQESAAGIGRLYGWRLAIGSGYGKHPRHKRSLSQRRGV